MFEAFFGKLDEFRRTFGSQLQAEVQRDMFYARARHYDSSLESALDANAIPVADSVLGGGGSGDTGISSGGASGTGAACSCTSL